jgi:hypothetical protein
MHADNISCKGQSSAFVPLSRGRHVPFQRRKFRVLATGAPKSDDALVGARNRGKDSAMSPLGLILVIILIIALLGGFSGRFGSYGYGHGGISAIDQ